MAKMVCVQNKCKNNSFIIITCVNKADGSYKPVHNVLSNHPIEVHFVEFSNVIEELRYQTLELFLLINFT